mmetsp:Transcript_65340/g.188208  ORF Transcript_65340/g.188208 Transcript_65340/m.188208 type:complete len:407 (+) Transcript_65340:804-2024(+)
MAATTAGTLRVPAVRPLPTLLAHTDSKLACAMVPARHGANPLRAIVLLRRHGRQHSRRGAARRQRWGHLAPACVARADAAGLANAVAAAVLACLQEARAAFDLALVAVPKALALALANGRVAEAVARASAADAAEWALGRQALRRDLLRRVEADKGRDGGDGRLHGVEEAPIVGGPSAAPDGRQLRQGGATGGRPRGAAHRLMHRPRHPNGSTRPRLLALRRRALPRPSCKFCPVPPPSAVSVCATAAGMAVCRCGEEARCSWRGRRRGWYAVGVLAGQRAAGADADVANRGEEVAARLAGHEVPLAAVGALPPHTAHALAVQAEALVAAMVRAREDRGGTRVTSEAILADAPLLVWVAHTMRAARRIATAREQGACRPRVAHIAAALAERACAVARAGLVLAQFL